MACRWREVVLVPCEICAGKPQFGFNDKIVPQVSAARQGYKQLGIRLTNGSVSSVSLFSSCLYPLAKIVAALKASSSASSSYRVWPGDFPHYVDGCPPLPKLLGLLCFPQHLNMTVARCKAVIKLHDAVSRHDTGTCTRAYAMSRADLQLETIFPAPSKNNQRSSALTDPDLPCRLTAIH